VAVKKSKPIHVSRLSENRIVECLERSHRVMRNAHDRILRTRMVKRKTQEIIESRRGRKDPSSSFREHVDAGRL